MRGKIIQRVKLLKPTWLRLVCLKLFCLLLHNKQGKGFEVRRKSSNRLRGKRQFIISWRQLWAPAVLLPNHAFTPEVFWDTTVSKTSAGWSPTCLQKRLHQTILRDRAACATIRRLLRGTSWWQSTKQGRTLFASSLTIVYLYTQKMNLFAGLWIQIYILSLLKLPSSVRLAWSIPGTRSSSFLQMWIWTWKPSFSLPTPSGSWDFPSFVKIVT